LLALLAWGGLMLQLALSLELAHSNGQSIGSGIAVFLSYFTILTNLFVALVASARALPKGRIRAWLSQRSIVGCATAAILLVGLSYHTLLREVWSPQGLFWVANADLHYVVPFAALVYWIILRGPRLSALAPLPWCLYPVAYFVYALLRGAWVGDYPYHFIDAAGLGYPQVWVNAVALLAVFLVLGYAVWGISRARDARA
jgi:hypothetical protein